MRRRIARDMAVGVLFMAAAPSSALAVGKATLTVTADDKSRVYGDANPSFTASYAGFQNGEGLATSGVSGAPDLTTSATATSASLDKRPAQLIKPTSE